MDKKITIIWVLVGLVFLSGIWDVYTTTSDKAFTVLESNPLFFIFHNLWLVILTKFLFLWLICWYYMKKLPNTKYNVAKYAWTYFIVCLICAQILIGFNNIAVKNKIADKLGYDSPSEANAEEVAKYMNNKGMALKQYMIILSILIYIPAILAITSFYIWEKLFYVSNNG